MVSSYGNNMDMELQQRAVEYCAIFSKHDNMRAALLERMPALSREGSTAESSLLASEEEEAKKAAAAPALALEPQQQRNENTLLDLLGGDSLAPPLSQAPPLSSNTVGGDLLNLLDMSSPPAASSSTTNQTSNDPTNLMALLGGGGVGGVSAGGAGGEGMEGLLQSSAPSSSPSSFTPSMNSRPAVPNIPPITVFEKAGLKIQFNFDRSPTTPAVIAITLTAFNSTPAPMSNFLFQAAVPKTFQLQMMSPSGNLVPPNNTGSVTQVINIANPQKQPLRMRIRLGYHTNGVDVQEQGEINDFPPQLVQ